MKHILYLGSNSPSRQQLLTDARIPFQVIGHSADETACDWGLPLPQVVHTIALSKMAHVIIPAGDEGQRCWVLTADTLSQDAQGYISGKPIDRADARKKIIIAREGMYTGTAFCLDRRVWRCGTWDVEQRITQFVSASYQFEISDSWLDTYLDTSIGMAASAAIAIEGYGGMFLKSLQGSYTTVVGLPLFELREALEELGFFSNDDLSLR